MPRLMFDSDKIDDLPRAAKCATYSDLIPDHATLAKLRSEFPHGLILIDRHGDPTGAASVLDVETSLHTAADAPGWFDRKQRQGILGTIYANRSTMPEVNAKMGPRAFWRWYATLDGTMRIDGFVPGHEPAAVQFATEQMLGFHCDCSVIWEARWHPDPIRWQQAGDLITALQRVGAELAVLEREVKAHI